MIFIILYLTRVHEYIDERFGRAYAGEAPKSEEVTSFDLALAEAEAEKDYSI